MLLISINIYVKVPDPPKSRDEDKPIKRWAGITANWTYKYKLFLFAYIKIK